MKHFKIYISLIIIMLVACTACKRNDSNVIPPASTSNQEQTNATQPTSEPTTNEPTQGPTDAPTQKPTDAPTQAPTQPPTQGPTQPENTDFSSITNESISFWYSRGQRNELGQPISAVNFQKQYGQYADFIKGNDKVIYLTFDEGYENGFSGKILDTLKEKNVKAVFFVTLDFATREPELVKRMISEGHIIGNHSCKHPAKGMPSLSTQGHIDDVMKLHNYVLTNFGYEMKLFRHPAGIYSERSFAILDSLGYRSVFWSFAHADWYVDNQPSVQTTLDRTTGELHNGAIYLLHAVSESNTNALAQFIDNARAKGYEFGKYY